MNTEGNETIVHNLPISITHTQREKYIRTKHIIEKPNFFEIDKITNDYITNHIKKFYLFLIKCDFKLIFHNDFQLHIETDFHHNSMMINLRRYLLNRIHDFVEKGYIFSQIDEMIFSTVNALIYVTYDKYIN